MLLGFFDGRYSNKGEWHSPSNIEYTYSLPIVYPLFTHCLPRPYILSNIFQDLLHFL